MSGGKLVIPRAAAEWMERQKRRSLEERTEKATRILAQARFDILKHDLAAIGTLTPVDGNPTLFQTGLGLTVVDEEEKTEHAASLLASGYAFETATDQEPARYPAAAAFIATAAVMLLLVAAFLMGTNFPQFAITLR